MTFVLAWVAFPVVLGLVGLGWGVLVEELSGAPLPSAALVIPVGLAAALVAAALFTLTGATAPVAVPFAGLVALAGLVRARPSWRRWRVRPAWWLVAAIGVLLAYGAPVLATGTATFTGYIKLDDTARWMAYTVHLFSDGHSTAGLAPSTYKLMFDSYLVAGAYPVGGFMLLGIGHGLTGVDVAWVYQPYLACAGGALAMCLYALVDPIVASARLRAVVAFVAAQPALLYGYSLWGGIKEMTAAFLLALLVALALSAIRERPAGPRATLPLGIAAAALTVTFGPGTAVWVVPALGAVVAAWLVAQRRDGRAGLAALAASVGALGAAIVVLGLPVWITLATSLRTDAGFAQAASSDISLANLVAPLSVFQLAGVWPVGDFREGLGSGILPIALIAVVVAAALAGGWLGVRARSAGPLLYAGVAVLGAAVIYLVGGVPWVVAKGLTIAAPGIPLVGLAGGAMLWARSRPVGALVIALIGGGVLWSNALAYRDVTLAPVGQLQDLEHIGRLVAGRGPTFVNDFAIYADQYFLRSGAPVEPADFRPVPLLLRDGTQLAMPAAADLDAFSVPTLMAYRSIVTTSSPAESRPPSPYRLVWAGRYYELWQRAARPTTQVLAHVPYGDSVTDPYCGKAVRPGGGTTASALCPLQPAGPANCAQVRSLARFAASRHGELVAPVRPQDTFIRGDQVPHAGVRWAVSPAGESLSAITPGAVSVQFSVGAPERVALWLGGSFGRGFEVSLDGRAIGRVENELSLDVAGAPVADVDLNTGSHTLTLTHPGPSVAPGSGNDVTNMPTSNILTTLTAIILAPIGPIGGQLVTLSPQQATSLCGKPVDWIEVVGPPGRPSS